MNICSRSVRGVAAAGGIGFGLGTVFPMKVTALTGGMVFGSLFATQMITNRIAAHAETKYHLTPEKVRKLEIALSIVATTALLVSFVAFGVLTGGQALGVFLLIELFQIGGYFRYLVGGRQNPTPPNLLFTNMPLLSPEEIAKREKEFRKDIEAYQDEQIRAQQIAYILSTEPLTPQDIEDALDLMKEAIEKHPKFPYINSGYNRIATDAAKIGLKDKAKEIALLIPDEAIRKTCLEEIEKPSPSTPLPISI